MTDCNSFLWAAAERNGKAHSFDMINLTLELRAKVEALEKLHQAVIELNERFSLDPLLTRVEALEGKYETQRLATLEWGQQVDKHDRWIDEHLKRIMALEAAQQQPEPIDEEENDRRFHACMDLIKNATPEQIRAAAGLPERSSLVERVAIACAKPCNETWDDQARAAIREVAAWLRELSKSSPGAQLLEQEAER